MCMTTSLRKSTSFLSPVDCRTARIYMYFLPKAHKPDNPRRPIVSGNVPHWTLCLFYWQFSEAVSEATDPVIPRILFVHDTADFLSNISVSQNQVPMTAIIRTFETIIQPQMSFDFSFRTTRTVQVYLHNKFNICRSSTKNMSKLRFLALYICICALLVFSPHFGAWHADWRATLCAQSQ